MTLWVITSLTLDPTPGSRTIHALTDLPAHLHLTTSPDYPTRTDKYRSTRGIRRICGFYLHWHNTTCGEQDEPGATLTHTFHTPTLAPLDTVYAALGESCPPAFRFPSTAPFPVTGLPTTMTSYLLALCTASLPIATNTWAPTPFDTVLASGGPNPPALGASGIIAPISGLLVITATLVWSFDDVGYRYAQLTHPTLGPLATATEDANGTTINIAQALSALIPVTAGDEITLDRSHLAGGTLGLSGVHNQVTTICAGYLD